jgi:hypothetical protein
MFFILTPYLVDPIRARMEKNVLSVMVNYLHICVGEQRIENGGSVKDEGTE